MAPWRRVCAWAYRRNKMHEPGRNLGRSLAIGLWRQPFLCWNARQVRHERWHIDDGVAVIDAACQLGVENAGRARIVGGLEIVSDCDEIEFLFGPVDRDCMSDMERAFDVCFWIGRYHPAKKRRFEAARLRALGSHSAKHAPDAIFAEIVFAAGFGILLVRGLCNQPERFLAHVTDFGPAQQQGLPVLPVLRLVPVQSLDEGEADRRHDFGRFPVSSARPFMTCRSMCSRERSAVSIFSIKAMFIASLALRQVRFRHWEEIRVRVTPPNGSAFASPQNRPGSAKCLGSWRANGFG